MAKATAKKTQTAKTKKIPAQKNTAAAKKKQTHKRRVKGTSEVDNPKYASKDLMLSLIDAAASKEDTKVEKKLAKKAHIAKIIEEKDAQKNKKAEEKKQKLEQVKQAYLEAQKKKKAEARKQKVKARAEALRQKTEPKAPEKKRVRFA